ncbi:condensation domain-containing protein [Actinophytocola sp.]|uniref:condensation domain-containing protein n=1 Tax=Actinophytocola sp. TaxID=1872138 RepID=UPI003D6AB002
MTRGSEVPRGEVVDRVLVAFEGEGAGEGELAFGQRGLWQSIVQSGASTVTYVAKADPGTTVDAVADMLGFMVGRHESLRTRLVLRGSGPPRQQVSAAGEIPLLVVASGADDPAEVAEALSMHWKVVPFVYETEWPVRMAAVVTGGSGGYTVTHVVTVFLHTSIDGFGLAALIADIRARDPETGAPAGPVTALPPLAQAAFEASPAGRRQNEQSMRYLERVLRTAPTQPFGEPRHEGTRRFAMLRYRSRAISMAVHTVAARDRLYESPVLLASFLVGVGRVVGVNPLPTLMMVSNRFRPGYADSVSALIKIVPFVLDIADLSMGEAVARASGKALNAYRNAYYDAYEQDEVVSRVERERGEEFDLSCFYNDRRRRDRVHAGVAAPRAAEIRAALADSELSWKRDAHVPKAKLHLCVEDPPGAVELVLSADERYFSRADLATLVRAIEEAAVQAATDPQAPTGITHRITADAVPR